MAHLIDLHMHSTASDGIYHPAHLMQLVKEAGLQTIALTDHDTTNGLAEAAQAAQALGLTLIPGIELNTQFEDREIHMLGYFIQFDNPQFQETLSFLRNARKIRAQKIVKKLQAINLKISWEDVLKHAEGTIGRPHIAQALQDKGYVDSIGDAFSRYIGTGCPGYVPRYRFEAEQAISLIRSVRGVPVIAHPYSHPGLSHLRPILAKFKKLGLLGLETYYGEYSQSQENDILQLAQAHDLVATGGSDFHGPNIHPTPLGGHAVPEESVTRLRQIAAELQGQDAPTFQLPELD